MLRKTEIKHRVSYLILFLVVISLFLLGNDFMQNSHRNFKDESRISDRFNFSKSLFITDVTPTPEYCKSVIHIPFNKSHWEHPQLNYKELDENENATNFLVEDIAFISMDEVLVATTSELLLLQNGQSHPIKMRTSLLSKHTFRVKIAPDKMIWIAYKDNNVDNWISSWDGDRKWNNYSFPGKIKDIAITKNGIIWVLYSDRKTQKNGLEYLKNGTWRKFILDNGSDVLAMAATSDSAIWFSTTNELFRVENEHLVKYSQELPQVKCPEMPEQPLQRLTGGGDSTIWGNIDSTIFNFDGKKYRIFSSLSYLSFTIGDIAVAPDGIVWAGFGFIKNDKSYIFDDLPFLKIYTVKVSPDGAIWYGTYDGIFIYDNSEQ
jgi:hypothetical protein